MDESVKLMNGVGGGGGGDGGLEMSSSVGVEMKSEPMMIESAVVVAGVVGASSPAHESAGSSSSSNSSSTCGAMSVGSISDEEHHHYNTERASRNKRSVGVLTETQDLGECAEPGSSILLEGVVWNETNKGVLILNVKWRGKTYVGSLIDTAKSSWASPRFKDFPKLKSSSSSATLANGNGFGSKQL